MIKAQLPTTPSFNPEGAKAPETTTVDIAPGSYAPITKWENEPKVTDLKLDYTEASGHHSQHVTNVGVWLDNMNITGAAKRKKRTGRSSIVPKLIRKQAEWRYAGLSEPFLGDEDLFETAPVSWEDKDAAIQNGIIINNQFNTKIDKTAFIDAYVRTAVDEGTIVVRTGWVFEEELVEVPDMQPQAIEDPAVVDQIMQAGQALQQDPAAAEQIPPEIMQMLELTMELQYPAQMVQVGTKMEMQTTKNQPTVEVCNYEDVIIDPTCMGDLKKANFIIFKFETSLSKLERAGKYTNLEHINTTNNSSGDEASAINSGYDFNFKDKPRKLFTAYEYWGYWDIRNEGKVRPIIATWVGDVMIQMEENPFPDQGLPFTLVQYLPKRFSVYGEPDGELLIDNQNVAGAVTRGMIDIMGRSAAGQKGIRKDALDVTNMRKFESGLDYKFNPNASPSDMVYDHVYPEIPASAQFMLSLQNAEAESLTGVKAFSGGITGDALGQTATGARGALDAASKRELGIVRRLAAGIIEIGRKIIAMNAVFLDDEEVVRVTNNEFVKIRRDDLAGEIDISLQISTAETDNAKAQELSFMLQTMGNSMPPEMSQMVLADIARLRKMPDLSKRIAEYQPQPDPIQEEMQKLELQKLQLELQKMQSEIAENQAQTELDMAKARELNTKADKTDLDFVEQESGVTQERDLQKHTAQADANKELKVLEAALKSGNEKSTP